MSIWAKEVVKKFAEILANSVKGFAFCFYRLSLKKLSNNKIYKHVKKGFGEELAKKKKKKKKRKIIEINKENNFNDRRKVRDYKKLDTSITRLRNKF